MTWKRHLRFASIAASGSESDASVGDKGMLRSDLTALRTVAASGPIRRKSAEEVCRLGVVGFLGRFLGDPWGIRPHLVILRSKVVKVVGRAEQPLEVAINACTPYSMHVGPPQVQHKTHHKFQREWGTLQLLRG